VNRGITKGGKWRRSKPILGKLEQLLLRGDGLTTTSLEILTGDLINVTVDSHWTIAVPSDVPLSTVLQSPDDSHDAEYFLDLSHRHLGVAPGERLLVREVLLVGPTGAVHGIAEVVARESLLPDAVADALATTDDPIGRLLRDNGVLVSRELTSWGLVPAGPRADRLVGRVRPDDRIAGRSYLMREIATNQPLAVLIERFGPHIFAE